MLFTVDEARALKPTLSKMKELGREYPTYKTIVNIFSIWFFVLTTIKSLVISTVIISMFNQETDLMISWSRGEGAGFFLLYLLISCLPLIGNFVNLIAPIAVIVAAFVTGSGIVYNFVPFVIPIAITYVSAFGLIFFSNYLINIIIKSKCPKIYEEIVYLSEVDGPSWLQYAQKTRTDDNDYITKITEEEDTEEDGVVEGEIVDRDNDTSYYDDTI